MGFDAEARAWPLAQWQLAQKWAAMRDCVGLGREHKYSQRQSEYHYTKDRKMLEEALAEECPK